MNTFNTKKSLVAALTDLGVKAKFNTQSYTSSIPQHRLSYGGEDCYIATNCSLQEIYDHAVQWKAQVQERRRVAAQQRAQVEATRKAEQQKATQQRRAEQRAETAVAEDRIVEVAKRLEANAWGSDASPHAKRVARIAIKARDAIEGHRKALVEFTDQMSTNSAYALEGSNDMFVRAANYKVAMQLGGAIVHAEANRTDTTTEQLAEHLNKYVLDEIMRRARNVPSSTSVTSNLMENYERAAWAAYNPSNCW